MTAPKRHHYLPEFYLAGFTGDGGRDSVFTVYDRATDKFRNQTPKDTAVGRYYYAIEDEHGERSMEIETFLSSIEGETAPVIAKLARREHPTDHEREVLALFCALLHTRVPQFDRSIQEMTNGAFQALARTVAVSVDEVRLQHEAFAARTGTPMEITPEEDFELLRSGGYRVEEPRQNVIKMMLQLSGELAEVFLNMRWAIAEVPRRMSLVVTDAPLLLIAPRAWQPGMPPFGIATPGTHKMFPLSRTVALFIGDMGAGFKFMRLTKGQVRENNLALAARSERFVIGCDDALVRSVVRRTRLHEAARSPLVVVE